MDEIKSPKTGLEQVHGIPESKYEWAARMICSGWRLSNS